MKTERAKKPSPAQMAVLNALNKRNRLLISFRWLSWNLIVDGKGFNSKVPARTTKVLIARGWIERDKYATGWYRISAKGREAIG